MKKYILCLLLCLLSAVAWCGPVGVWDMTDPASTMTIANEGDGSTLDAEREGFACRVINGEIARTVKYFYFRLSDEIRQKAPSEGWVVLWLWSPEGNITSMTLELNQTPEHFCVAEDTQLLMGDGKWHKVAFHFKKFVPLGLLNYGNDLRISVDDKAAVRRAELYDRKPDMELYDFVREVGDKIASGSLAAPRGMSYVVGNDASVPQAFLFRSMGFTAVDSYSTWQTVEPDAEGEWDFSKWESQVSILRQAGLKWVPLLCAGPAYANPNWFRETRDHFPCVCLEHGEANKIESLWNPNFAKWRKRYIAEFARHFSEEDIDNIKVGIQGDYGEAIYSADGGGWTFNVPGPYHQHHGWWCNDEYALADYRQAMKQKYGTIARLNRAWQKKYAGFEQVDFPFYGEEAKAAFINQIQEGPKGRREFLDFREWYRSSMTKLADEWMAQVRSYFPNTKIYLSTGGFMMPQVGCHFPDQAKAAAKSGAGIRITNEGSVYADNFAFTRIVASACRHYGTYFCYEPAGEENFWGIPARIYNAAASGAAQLHDYFPNITSARELVEQQQKHLAFLRKTDPVVPIAVWYPDTDLSIYWDSYMDRIIPRLRDYFDFGQLDESLVADGALSEYRVFVIPRGRLMEETSARKIAAWAKRGGRVYVVGVDKFVTPEEKASPENWLFPGSHSGGPVGKGFIRRVADYEELARCVAKDLKELGYAVYPMEEDNIFYTQTAADRMLVFSGEKTPEKHYEVQAQLRGRTFFTQVEGGSIAELELK